ncbi:MAG: AMP-binding protein [Deltaproteobacteria bacterium]|nr:AMP-binding protein [Deltaproteobacteria bacterium]MBW2447103.1 AMP-binding protein [Deltaproteobacteria bacterium]
MAAPSSTEANTASWLERHADERPGAEAVIDAHRRLDYDGLAARVARCAGVLEARGVGRGDRVAILMGNHSPYLETAFAAAQLGAMAVPVNTRWSPREIAVLLDDCTPRAVVHDAERAAGFERALGAARHCPEFRLEAGPPDAPYEAALAAARPHPGPVAVSPDDPMILMYTSGTTGAPKGALLPHRKTLYNARNAERFFALSAEDRVLVVLPLFHSFGLAILSTPTLYAGGTVILHPQFDPAAVWRAVADERVTFFGAVPTMFRHLHEELAAKEHGHYALETLRFLFTAGAAIPVELILAYERRGLVLKQGFGQTETSILTCLDAGDAVRKAGSVGRPVHHGELRVVAREGIEGPVEAWRDVATGETGEIVVRGPTTMLGYWERPEETAATLRGEWLRTGDLATVDDEGFLTLVGRARELYISGGENVYPAEVEAVLETHPAVREVAIVGEPDERWGEVGRAFLALEPGAELDPEEFHAFARERLAVFKIPKRLVTLKELPRTETGKIQKWKLTRIEETPSS